LSVYMSDYDDYDDDYEYDPSDHMTNDPVGFYTHGYGGYGYDTSHVPRDEAKPELVKHVEEGNLQAVRDVVESVATTSHEEKNKLLNYARRWTEVDYRMSGFTKEYEWFDLTPLATAALKGHHNIVQYLLEQGADPTLEGCPSDNVHLDALQAANKKLGSAFDSGNRATWNIPRRCVDLLSVANFFWNKAAYSGSGYSQTKRVIFSNRATNMEHLQQALNEVSDIAEYPQKSLKKEDLKSLKAKYIS